MYYFNNEVIDLDALSIQLRDKFIEYMIENHNIESVDDELEKKIYELVWQFLETIIIR